MYRRTIAKVINLEVASRFKSAIHGQSLMDFQVLISPVRGEFEVSVTSDYDAPHSAIDEMLFMLMFEAIVT